MAISIEWRSGDDSVVIPSEARIGFFGTNFGDSVGIGSYQGSTFVTNDFGSAHAEELPNVQFQANFPEGKCKTIYGVKSIDEISPWECTLHLRMTTGVESRIQAAKFIAYASGSFSINDENDIVAGNPSNVKIAGFEWGDSNWTIIGGDSQPLMLTPYSESSGRLNHDYYIGLSAQPLAIGINTSIMFAAYVEWY